jgi:YceI-like domain
VRAPIHNGTAETGSHPAVEIHVDARQLRVIDKDASEKERADVQRTMLGLEVLDSEQHPEIVFRSTAAESAGQDRWTLRGNLTLLGADTTGHRASHAEGRPLHWRSRGQAD